MDLHEVLRVRPGFAADDQREHDAIVGIPGASGDVGDRGVVAGRDAAPDTPLRIAERTVVDPHTSPTHESPVDVGLAIVEERLPARLHQCEQSLLVVDVAIEGRQIPGEQVVGDGLPRAAVGHRIVCQAHPRQRLEGGDRLLVDRAVVEEPEEVGEYPAQPRIRRQPESGNRADIDLGRESGPDGLEFVDSGLPERTRRHGGCRGELVAAEVPQRGALDRVQVVSTRLRGSVSGLLHFGDRPGAVGRLQLDDVLGAAGRRCREGIRIGSAPLRRRIRGGRALRIRAGGGRRIGSGGSRYVTARGLGSPARPAARRSGPPAARRHRTAAHRLPNRRRPGIPAPPARCRHAARTRRHVRGSQPRRRRTGRVARPRPLECWCRWRVGTDGSDVVGEPRPACGPGSSTRS